MNKKSIAALSLAAVMTFGIGASYAWFTSQATSTNNIVKTGTLVIGGPWGSAVKTFTLDNLYPGASGSKSDNITIRNNGTINMKYNVSANWSYGDSDLYNKALVKVTKTSGIVVYDGPLNTLNNYLANNSLPAGSSETLNFTVSLPENTDDTYQGKATAVNFVFNAGQTAFVQSSLTGEWTNDRTEPATWSNDKGWITYSTKEEPANTWYAWQGKKITNDSKLSSNWKVETEFNLTDKLLERNGVRTSMWLNVLDQYGQEADWSILQFKIDKDTNTKGWQYWDGTVTDKDGKVVGAWKDIATDVPTTAGVYKLAISYDNGNVFGYLNGIQVFKYAIAENYGTKLSSVKEVIYNSYSFGESYEVQWKVPTISYVQN